MPKAGGKWNTYEITAKGSQLTVVLNGVKTVNLQHGKYAAGPFALQYGGVAKDSRRPDQVAQGADQAAIARANQAGFVQDRSAKVCCRCGKTS